MRTRGRTIETMNILTDPTFDLSSSMPSPTWEIESRNGDGAIQAASVLFRAGLGLAGSNAVDLAVSGSTRGALTMLLSADRLPAQPGWFEFQIRYQTIGIIGGDHSQFYVGPRRFIAIDDTPRTFNAAGPFTLPRSSGRWTFGRIPAQFEDNPQVPLWTFICVFFNAPSQDDLRLDSFDVVTIPPPPQTDPIFV